MLNIVSTGILVFLPDHDQPPTTSILCHTHLCHTVCSAIMHSSRHHSQQTLTPRPTLAQHQSNLILTTPFPDPFWTPLAQSLDIIHCDLKVGVLDEFEGPSDRSRFHTYCALVVPSADELLALSGSGVVFFVLFLTTFGLGRWVVVCSKQGGVAEKEIQFTRKTKRKPVSCWSGRRRNGSQAL